MRISSEPESHTQPGCCDHVHNRLHTKQSWCSDGVAVKAHNVFKEVRLPKQQFRFRPRWIVLETRQSRILRRPVHLRAILPEQQHQRPNCNEYTCGRRPILCQLFDVLLTQGKQSCNCCFQVLQAGRILFLEERAKLSDRYVERSYLLLIRDSTLDNRSQLIPRSNSNLVPPITLRNSLQRRRAVASGSSHAPVTAATPLP